MSFILSALQPQVFLLFIPETLDSSPLSGLKSLDVVTVVALQEGDHPQQFLNVVRNIFLKFLEPLAALLVEVLQLALVIADLALEQRRVKFKKNIYYCKILQKVERPWPPSQSATKAITSQGRRLAQKLQPPIIELII